MVASYSVIVWWKNCWGVNLLVLRMVTTVGSAIIAKVVRLNDTCIVWSIFLLDLADSEPIDVIFPPGSTSTAVTVPVVDDDLLEDAELFMMVLSGPSIGSVNSTDEFANALIIDNDRRYPSMWEK